MDVQRETLKALQAQESSAAARDAERTKADAAMTKHQKRMNWWILSVTGAGILTAIAIKFIGG